MGSHICCTCALLDTVALAPAQTPRAAQTATREAMLLIVFMTDHCMDLTCFKTNIDIDVDIDIVFSSRRVSGPSTRSTCKDWPPASWGAATTVPSERAQKMQRCRHSIKNMLFMSSLLALPRTANSQSSQHLKCTIFANCVSPQTVVRFMDDTKRRAPPFQMDCSFLSLFDWRGVVGHVYWRTDIIQVECKVLSTLITSSSGSSSLSLIAVQRLLGKLQQRGHVLAPAASALGVSISFAMAHSSRRSPSRT